MISLMRSAFFVLILSLLTMELRSNSLAADGDIEKFEELCFLKSWEFGQEDPTQSKTDFLSYLDIDPSFFSMEKRQGADREPFLYPAKGPCEAREKKRQDDKLESKASSDLIRTSVRPPLQIEVESSGKLNCDAAFLIWQSKMWGFEFAGKSFFPTNGGAPSISLEEKDFVPDFAWRPGFKIDLGYEFAFDGWSLDSRWTFYKGEDTALKKSFASQINPPGMGVIPLWFYPFYNVESPNQISFSQGKMSWRHYFNSIDLEMGRYSDLSDRLSMRLFGGLKGAWMRQFYRVDYQNGTTIAAIVPGTDGTVPYTLLASASSFKNETWGAGPRAGLNSKWKIYWGFSLIADASLSLIFSKIETHRDQNDLNLNTLLGALQPFHMHMVTNSHQLKPVAEAKLGLDWERCIYSKSTIGFTLGYEIQYWWAQNELRRNYTHAAPGNLVPMRGDLQMHGLTAEVAYSY